MSTPTKCLLDDIRNKQIKQVQKMLEIMGDAKMFEEIMNEEQESRLLELTEELGKKVIRVEEVLLRHGMFMDGVRRGEKV